MHTETALVLTVLVLCYSVVSGLINRWYIAPALVFVVLGMVLGPFGAGVLEAGGDTAGFTVLAQLALTAILFNQAAETDLRGALRRGRVTFRLLVFGIPLTIALGTVTALVLLPVMPLWEAICLAAVVAPTEVALIEALLDDRRIPERVRHVMSTESGCYDGFALAVVLAVLAFDAQRTEHEPARWLGVLLRTEVLSLGVGVAIGALGGLLLVRAHQRGWMSETWARLATLAVALVCFEVAESFHGSGFVAAFAGGLAYSWAAHRAGTEVPTQFSDAAASLLELLVFALFGASAVIVGWRDTSWQVVAFGLLAVIAVRLAAVLVALLGTDLPRVSRLFIGWFGPRGIGTLVLGLLVIQSGDIEHADVFTQAVAVTVTISLVLQSLTAPIGIRLVSRDRLVTSGS